ncbi:hypothetical protein CP533_1622 [Ophiocordyceps camponoti-saundersi (nom. inval.)]|nr:hypothetical protein CP533_1622 [Ophiocordyceps camponoti-saundersi (nom. inval.)]
MMTDIKDLTPDLDRLEAQLDDLEDALAPLTNGLDERASRLPLLDRAKLFSLSAYAIESLLFSSLRLHGVDAKEHAVFTELKRVQQYFAKIQAAEEGPETKKPRSLTVNQEAAARMLKANLSDNKSVSNKLAEKIAEERAKALLKAVEGSGSGSGRGNGNGVNKRPAEEESTTEEKKKKRSRSAPVRPSAPRPAPAPQQQRPSSTMAPSTTTAPTVAPQAQGPGLFGQMASTAAGVAIGSSVGHAIGGFFGGGSSSEQAPAQQDQTPAPMMHQQQAQQPLQYEAPACQPALADFNRCLQEKNDIYSCGWYFEQLKACRAAAAGQ